MLGGVEGVMEEKLKGGELILYTQGGEVRGGRHSMTSRRHAFCKRGLQTLFP
jgi:hypothetical protein